MGAFAEKEKEKEKANGKESATEHVLKEEKNIVLSLEM